MLKLRNSEPPKPQPVDANETILVVGGGVSGLTSAIAAAKAGNSVVLTEKEDKLGGWLNKFHKVNLGNSPFTEIESTGIEELISEVESNEKIKVYTSCLIEKVSGAPGDYTVTIKINRRSTIRTV